MNKQLLLVISLIIFSLSSKDLLAACGRPGNLQANNISSNSADLSWNAVSGAVRYKLRYKINGTSGWTTINVFENNTQITGLIPGTTYRFRVKAICSSGSSRYSRSKYFTTQNAGCSTPIGLVTFGIGSNQATLTWQAVSGATSYTARIREVGTSSWTNINNISSNLTIASGLLPLKTYEYQVSANCSSGSSPFSPSQTFTTPENVCTTPTGLSLIDAGTSFATINWNPVGGTEAYLIRYREIGTTEWQSSGIQFSAPTTATINDLFPNTQYEAQVRSECQLGSTPFSDLLTFTTDQIANCDAPSNLFANLISATAATHNWDAVTGAVEYTLRRRVAGTTPWTFEHTTTATSLQTFLLTPGTTYEFQVQTHCVIDDSPFSASAFYTTQADNPCGTPENLTTSNITPSAAMFRWDAVSGALQYTLQHRPSGTSTWTSVTTTQTIISRSGLSPGTTYDWRVGALCTSGGTIAFSGIENFTTQAAGTCPVPTGLFPFGITSIQATLTWHNNAEANNFDARYRPTGTSTWTTTTNINSNLVIASGLTPATEYEFQVRSNCSNGSSAFSASRVFATRSSSLSMIEVENNPPRQVNDSQEKHLTDGLEIDIELYPNPSKGNFTLNIRHERQEPVMVRILNQMGQVEQVKAFDLERGNNRQIFNLDHLAPGMYIFFIETKTNRVSKKLIIHQ